MSAENPSSASNRSPAGRKFLLPAIICLIAAAATAGVAVLLVTIVEHKQEARQPYVRLVEVDEGVTDPKPWGTNWPHQYDQYLRSVDTTETEYGGSSAMPASKLEADPWLKRLYAGYAFSIDYREARGHAFMLHDQEVTERVTKRTQSGACLHCHSSVIPTYRRLGMEAMGEDPTPEKLAESFTWPAVLEGFRLASTMTYEEAHAELVQTPDGTPDDPHGPHEAHPVSCVDCHDPDTLALRVTRPGFVDGIARFASSDEPAPHLPSIEAWREGPRDEPYDPNRLATRQEMRSFACAQCHVEYYCASKETLFFPWERGLKAEQIEAAYDAHDFPDGEDFYDWKHGETGAKVYKAQHPEFELWSQGVHARSGVSCADCHMPYERQGAAKVSSHWVRSPMLNINNACQTCHNVPESELRDKVEAIQTRTRGMLDRAAVAMTDMLDAIREAEAAGASDAQLAQLHELQKKAMWRLDFISSENSMGFHADQEAVRVLGESIDYSRQAQALANRIRAPEAPTVNASVKPIQGVTPTRKAPIPEG